MVRCITSQACEVTRSAVQGRRLAPGVRSTGLWCLLVLGTLSTPPGVCLAGASVATPDASTSPAAADTISTADDSDIKEIVVTARLRNEGVTRSPTIVTALSGDQLQQEGITSIEGLASAVPNVSITPYFLTDAIYIRGIGNNGLQAGFEQQAGLFIDGIYYGNGNWVNGGLMDVETAEVLEGPQGAYFGKNTIAGAFNIHTANPTDQFFSYVRTGYEFDAKERYITAVASGPLTSTLSARLAVYASRMSGWGESIEGNSEPGDRSEIARLTLLWKPTDNFDANLKAQISGYQDNGIWEGGILIRCGGPDNTPAPLLRFGSPGYAPCALNTTIPIVTNTPLGPSYDTEPTNSTALNMHWRQSVGELSSVTGVNGFHFVSVGAQDFGSINSVDGYNANKNEQFSQELRYQTKLDIPVNFLGGGYYQQSQYRNDNYANVYPMAVQDALYTFEKVARQHGKTASAFVEAQWKILDQLELDVSDRYTHERKTANWVEQSVAPYAPAQALYGPAGALITVPPLVFDNSSPQAILSWKPTDDFMAYASYKTGYLSGGFNINTQASPRTNPAALVFGEETTKGGEVGTKFWLNNRTIQLNADAYYYKYHGLQESIFNPVLISYVVQNAAGSVDKGVELSGTAALGKGFTLSAGVNYNESVFTDYIGQCEPGTVAGRGACDIKLSAKTYGEDYDGVHTSNAPLWSGQIHLTNQTHLNDTVTLRTGVGATIQSSYIVDDILSQPGYAKLDANIAVLTGPWTVAFIGRNLTDHLSCGIASPQPLSTSSGEIRCILERPREERLEVQYQF